MQLDEMTMTDLAAMFAMMGLIAEGGLDTYAGTATSAYAYADEFIKKKQQREQENEDGSR